MWCTVHHINYFSFVYNVSNVYVEYHVIVYFCHFNHYSILYENLDIIYLCKDLISIFKLKAMQLCCVFLYFICYTPKCEYFVKLFFICC